MVSNSFTFALLGLAALAAAKPLPQEATTLPAVPATTTTTGVPTTTAVDEAAIDAIVGGITAGADDSAVTDAVATTTTGAATTTSPSFTTIESSLESPMVGGSLLPAGSTDVEKWCKTLDVNDPEAVAALWEDGLSPGGYLDIWTMSTGMDKWPMNMTGEVLPTSGDPKIGGCGVFDGQCDPDIDCEEMVGELGMPQAYWILRALAGYVKTWLESPTDLRHPLIVLHAF